MESEIRLKKDIDAKEFSRIVYDLSMMLESGTEFHVRELFALPLWESIDTNIKGHIGQNFDNLLKKENYENIKKLDKDHEGVFKYGKI